MTNGFDQSIEIIRALISGLPGIDGAEVVLRHRKSLKLESNDLKLESSVASDSIGVGLRLVKNKRVAQSYCSTTDIPELKATVSRCEKMLEDAPEDQSLQIEPMAYDGPSASVQFVDNTFSMIPTEEKIQRLFNLESNVLKSDPSIKRTRGTQYQESHLKEWLWTLGSKKVLNSERNWGYLATSAVAELPGGKDAQIGSEYEIQSQYYNLNWSAVAKNAGQLASKLLGARSLPTGHYSVLFNNRVMTDLVELLGAAFSGENVNRGLSFLKNDLGKKVFSPLVHLYGDPHLSKAVGSCYWDSEGTPTSKMSFVKDGIVQNFSYNHRSARVAKTKSTGHAIRRSERGGTEVGFHNLCLEPGNKDYVDLLREMNRGLVVYKVLGIHTANPVTGDFSFGASGMWVENGSEQRPVSGVAVAGNIKTLFSRVTAIGRDIRWVSGVGSPSVVFEDVSVSGE